MDQKITFLKNELKDFCRDIIGRMEGEDLLKAYLLLKELSSTNLSIAQSINANTIDDFENLLLQYEIKLKAAGKAEITIKNYLAEVKKFLIFLKDGKYNLEILKS